MRLKHDVVDTTIYPLLGNPLDICDRKTDTQEKETTARESENLRTVGEEHGWILQNPGNTQGKEKGKAQTRFLKGPSRPALCLAHLWPRRIRKFIFKSQVL